MMAQINPRRNSVDKRTVIENYDLVVGNPALGHTSQADATVSRHRRAGRRRHHPRDGPRRRSVTRQPAARAGYDVDEEHRPLRAGFPERMGVWQATVGREDTAGPLDGRCRDAHRRWGSYELSRAKGHSDDHAAHGSCTIHRLGRRCSFPLIHHVNPCAGKRCDAGAELSSEHVEH